MANILAKEGRKKRPKKLTVTIRREYDKYFGQRGKEEKAKKIDSNYKERI
jgi:hypothetical protein